jgi:hypothetical protein
MINFFTKIKIKIKTGNTFCSFQEKEYICKCLYVQTY